MYENYCRLRDKKGYKDADVAKATGITKSTFSDWKSGRSNPKNDKLQKIAAFLGVSVDYFTSGEEKRPAAYYLDEETRDIAQEIFENPDLKSLFDMSRKMTPDRLKAHLEFMKKLEDAENN